MFDFKNIKGDLFGGVTAGIVALPLALAFGVSSGLGPTAGLYGAIFISFFAALFGGTNTQVSGPTAPMTAVSMVLIAGILATMDGDRAAALPIILTVFALSGIFQISLGIIGIGKYIKYIPYPVVSGFMTAIGIMILFGQLAPAVGYNVKNDKEHVLSFKAEAEEKILEDILKEEAGKGILVLEHFEKTINRSKQISEDQITKEATSLASLDASGVVGAIKIFPRLLKNINWLELALTLGTISIIYGFKRITKIVPSTLVALLVMSLIAVGFGFVYKPIEEITGGIPIPNFEIITGFNISTLMPYVITAFSLAILGAIDSLLTSVVADNMTKTKHKPNKELIGQGIGNTIGAFFGGLPGAGATIRTVVNINSGGKTRLSGMFSGLMLLIVLLALGPIASKVPAAVLAGILITVGIGVMDYKGLRAIPKMPLSEVCIMAVVCILSVVWSLIFAVGVGLIIASLLFMKKIGDLSAANFSVNKLSDNKKWKDESSFPENLKEEVFIKHIGGPIFFGSTSEFSKLLDEIPDNAVAVIIRMDRSRYMDQSGLYAIEDTIAELAKKDIKILIVKLWPQPQVMLQSIDIIPALVPEDQLFENFDTCVEWIKLNIEDKK
jgi:SulP family sulfate permease